MPTKQFIDALANALRYEKPGRNWNVNKMIQWELDVMAVARCLRAADPNFKLGKFYEACEFVPREESL